MSYDTIAKEQGMCGHIHPECGFVCTLADDPHDLHRCVTPSKDPDGICTGEWGEDDPGWFNKDVAAQLNEQKARPGVSMPPETVARVVMRNAELSVQLDDEVARYRRLNHPDETKVVAFAHHFVEEGGGVAALAELLAVAVQKLASQ
jgi:hypothetical protein